MTDQPSLSDETLILRALDANANRALEGLRVVEDYARFVLADRHLAEAYKQLRHSLSSAVEAIPARERLVSRDTLRDVGTQVSAPDEYRRESAWHIAAANQKRVEQAVRCLEEFAKPRFPAAAAKFEQIRYSAYTLARAVAGTVHGQQRLAGAQLYVLVGGEATEDQLDGLCTTLIRAGTHVLQLRHKGLSDRELIARARRLRALTRATHTLFIVNDRPDVALVADADGVHVGQDELSVHDARQVIGPRRLVGVSTHSLAQARQAVLDGADYIGCGPTFPSSTKHFAEFPGCDFLRQVAHEIRLPAFAIGGITLENLPTVLDCGFRRVAVSSSIASAFDPAAAARQFLASLGPMAGLGGDPG